jgi:hypothetical protein
MPSDIPTPAPSGPQKQQLNRGGYLGERIDIAEVLLRLETKAIASGWIPDPILCSDGTSLPAFRRSTPDARGNIYVSAGIHGDEPAGPLAIQCLIEQAAWPTWFNYWLVPCLNPSGFQRNTRESDGDIDLNRDYRHPRAKITRGHIGWLERQPRFDLALLLHEDWEANGFYLYELNPDSHPSVAAVVIETVRQVCPIEHAEEVDGRPAEGGMIRFIGSIPEREEWPEALHLIYHKTRLNYTLESPSDYPLSVRIDALVKAVQAALKGYQPNDRS